MNNFLEFIEKDISAKKTLISTMPKKTKTNQKKLNSTIADIEKKYDDYKTSVRNYMLAKSRSFSVKNPDDSDKIAELKERILSLGEVKFLLNPSNTYLEKMGFDNLLYQISNYYVFNFSCLNDIINAFLDKFEQADVKITSADFDYTCYVHEYMSAFLDVRNKKVDGYDKVSEIFEQVYWVNPDIVAHIELNFRRIIKKNARKFEVYLSRIQKEVMHENKVDNYASCLDKLEACYIELNMAQKEDIGDIIELAKQGKIDISHYLEDSKVRAAAYDLLIPESVDRTDKKVMSKIYRALAKFTLTIDEYKEYLEFAPLFENFKNEYAKLVKTEQNTKKGENKDIKTIEANIVAKENELNRINKKIFSGKPGLFEFKSDKGLKQLKQESVHIAKELYTLYEKYDAEYFKDKVSSILNNMLTVSDVLNLYSSYDYFKKIAIKKVYNLDKYEDILEYSNNFDSFALDPTNIIIDGIPVFEEVDIPKIIANKYRLNNIKISEDELDEGNLESLKGQIELLIRIDTIENSTLDIEKIWFMTQVEKLVAKEKVDDK